ncbi:peptidoglycan-binding protein [Streptomyces sp. NPDC050421]|uniref:peptidoglycan-binding protein n=1 Tax=Streptomyces sp. NPDC050421 TaxID=3365613 RepID=UPI0037AA1C28
MKLVTRAQWGARTPTNGHTAVTSNYGVKIHYLGTPYEHGDHSTCAPYMRKLQNYYMDSLGWADWAYNFGVCEHGYVFEGRGLNAQNSANGNTTLNRNHFAVNLFVGSSGSTKPTAAQLQGARDAVAYLRAHGAGKEIKGHRDGYATECPGNALYALLKAGEFEPKASAPAKPAYEPFPGATFFKSKPKSPIVTAMGKRLVAVGCSAYSTGPGPQWTEADRLSFAKFQRKLGDAPAYCDGYPGAKQWAALKVPKV